MKILMSHPAGGVGAPGEILDADHKLIVACGDGALEIVTAQRAGKRPQEAGEFMRGFPLDKGARLR